MSCDIPRLETLRKEKEAYAKDLEAEKSKLEIDIANSQYDIDFIDENLKPTRHDIHEIGKLINECDRKDYKINISRSVTPDPTSRKIKRKTKKNKRRTKPTKRTKSSLRKTTNLRKKSKSRKTRTRK